MSNMSIPPAHRMLQGGYPQYVCPSCSPAARAITRCSANPSCAWAGSTDGRRGNFWPRLAFTFPPLASCRSPSMGLNGTYLSNLSILHQIAIEFFQILYWLVVSNILIPHILGMSSSQLTNSYFSEG